MKSTSGPGFTKKTGSGKEELDFQSVLLKSVKDQGGYGRKVAHFQLRGISDLLVQMPHHTMVQIECKDLGQCIPSFNRQLETTQHQRDHMEALCKTAGGYTVAFVAVRYIIEDFDFLTFLPWNTERVTRAPLGGITLVKEGKRYPLIGKAFANFGVPYITERS